MKIAVIGYSGSGKSTLAKMLSERLGCPVLYLDTVNFEAGWKERDRDEGRAIVRAFMEKNAGWVIDGNYGSLLQKERLEEADRILFLNFPRAVCFAQAFRRYLSFRGKTRESIATGCNEKFDWEFARWLLHEGRTAPRRRHYREIVRAYPEKTVVLKTRAAVRRYLAKTANCFPSSPDAAAE